MAADETRSVAVRITLAEARLDRVERTLDEFDEELHDVQLDQRELRTIWRLAGAIAVLWATALIAVIVRTLTGGA